MTPFFLVLAQALGSAEVATDTVAHPGNILLVVADDVGVDQLAAYGEGQDVPWTPTIDALASEGVLFRHAYATPYCSPTRASILTGRHPFRHGIGTYIVTNDASAFALSPQEVTLPELLLEAPIPFATAAIGKWHLGSDQVGGPVAPNLAGFPHFAGSLGNITAPETYYAWPKVVNGTEGTSTSYATTDAVDAALAWIGQAQEPWLCYVAFHAVHTPLHEPPPGTYVVDLSTAHPHLNPRPYYVAAAEAMDLELGRLLASLGPELDRTNVIFLGDNGSPADMVVAPIPKEQCKGTTTEGGIGVPLIVRGPAVAAPGAEVEALVQSTDLFATVAELAGVDLASALPVGHAHDSISLVPYLADPAMAPLRATAFAELFEPNGFGPYDERERTLRDARYKLVVTDGAADRLYDLAVDPYEANDLLTGALSAEEQVAYDALVVELAAILGS